MNETLQLRQTHLNSANEPLILCTIIEKTGSSYRGLFAKKIVFKNQMRSVGLLSGGCLEKEVEELARSRYQDLPFIHSFDTMNETDRLLGYQKGCSGVISILFERLHSDNPTDLYFPFGADRKAAGVAINLSSDKLGERTFVEPDAAAELSSQSELLVEDWKSPVELTLIGCGADADPYLNLVKSLGWKLRILDYRSDLAREDRFSADADFKPELVTIDQIPEALKQGPKTAVVLMTHNYESDLHIFSELLGREFGYLGLLGPRRRYELMQKDLRTIYSKNIDLNWAEGIVKSPAGMTSSDRSPEAIAFSVVADIQMKLGALP